MADQIANKITLAFVGRMVERCVRVVLHKACATAAVLLAVGIALPATAQSLAQVPKGGVLPVSVSAKNRLVQALAAMPLTFEKNVGQADERVSFLSRMSGYTLFLTGTDSVFVHSGKARHSASALRIRWLGASSAAIPEGDAQMGGKSNYLIGNDSTRWHWSPMTKSWP